ncbi:hypothetical protein [Xylophilus sp.]|uniref:hypothetical protein n=1 Tax=Xylophilus sp. TaxID=2653893 RepID=UPI002D7ED829|nr:hypothetical protein [Xylophilus sp.]
MAIRKAISGYYSGNFTTGFRPEPAFGGTSHVQRVLANNDLPAVPALNEAEREQASRNDGREAVRPTYQSWDVLRQYPRYDLPAAAQPVAQPPTLKYQGPEESDDEGVEKTQE